MVGSAETEGNRTDTRIPEDTEADRDSAITVAEITEPRTKQDQRTARDPSLETIRRLADLEVERYQWNQCVIVRHRLDEWGDSYQKLCSPKEYRSQCLNLSHERFGYLGRYKMSQSIKKLFHRPNMFTDIAKHCKSCDICQKHIKNNPKPCPMQEREVVSVPSE